MWVKKKHPRNNIVTVRLSDEELAQIYAVEKQRKTKDLSTTIRAILFPEQSDEYTA